MVSLKKYAKDIIFAFSLILLFFSTRIYNILSLPMFTDEAIYTRWSQIAKQDAGWRFISLTDGKQPLFVWFDMIFMKVVQDPLLAGRLVSLGAGFFTMIGLFFLATEIFKNKKIGFAASLIYVFYPFSLVYDRMALYDSLVASIAVWALYFEVMLVRLKRLDIALILGMVLGAGTLTKSNAFFIVYLLPFSLLLFNLRERHIGRQFIKWSILALLSAGLALFYYSILRLSPFFHIIAEKNATFAYPFSEWVQHPFTFLEGNLKGVIDWLVTYSTFPLLFFTFASFIIGKKKFLGEKLLLLSWFLIPFVSLALFGKTLYPRFILFMTMPLLILASFSLIYILDKMKKNILKALLFFAFILLMLRSDYYILTNFAHAPIPYADLQQYVNDWPAGGGINEMIEFLKFQASTGKIYVASQGTFGSLPTYAVEIYLGENKNIDKRGIWPIHDNIPPDLVEKAKQMPVYFIFNQTSNPPFGWPVRLIAKYQKGAGNAWLSIYQVVSE